MANYITFKCLSFFKDGWCLQTVILYFSFVDRTFQQIFEEEELILTHTSGCMAVSSWTNHLFFAPTERVRSKLFSSLTKPNLWEKWCDKWHYFGGTKFFRCESITGQNPQYFDIDELPSTQIIFPTYDKKRMSLLEMIRSFNVYLTTNQIYNSSRKCPWFQITDVAEFLQSMCYKCMNT